MKSFLVVDDSPVVRKIVNTILNEYGFTVMEAENGRQAYEICEQHMPDAIFLDACTPVMSGLDFLASIGKITTGTPPKILYCACEIDEKQIRAALDTGANDYIVKPFNKEILEAKLKNIGVLENA